MDTDASMKHGAEARNNEVEDDTRNKDDVSQLDVAIETGACTEDEVQEIAPDGGWGWLVLLGRVIVASLAGGSSRSEGILYVKFKERYGESATATTWVSSGGTIRYLAGPIVSLLCHRFTCRQLTIFGSALTFAGHMSSAFAPNLTFLFFSNACLNGIGRAFAATPSMILLGQYFHKKRSLAFGLAAAGISMGGFTVVPMTEFWFQTYGFQGTFILLSGLFLNYCVGGFLFRSIETNRMIIKHDRRKKKHPVEKDSTDMEVLMDESREPEPNNVENSDSRMNLKSENEAVVKTSEPREDITQDLTDSDHCGRTKEKLISSTIERIRSNTDCNQSISSSSAPSTNPCCIQSVCRKVKGVLSDLKDVRFITFALATFCFSLNQTNTFLPPLFRAAGMTDYETASIISVSAMIDTVSRVAAGLIFNLKIFRNHRPMFFNIFPFTNAILTFLVPFMTSYPGFLGIGAALGIVLGFETSLETVVLLDILGVHNLPNTLAVLMFMQFLGKVVGPTVSGLLIDTSNDYGSAFYFAGVSMMTGSLILLAGNVRKAFKDRTQSTNKLQPPDS